MLGFLNLSRMLIKNAFVLVDQIKVELADGKKNYDAILASGTHLLRPAAMAAATTMALLPLVEAVQRSAIGENPG